MLQRLVTGRGLPITDRKILTCAVLEGLERWRRGNSRALRLLEIMCCAVLAGLLLWKGILPGWRVLNTDFPNYYLVGRLIRESYALDRIYDWVWLQRVKDHWGLEQPLVGFAGLSPFSALPVVPLTFFSALTAKHIWMVANIFLLGSSVELLRTVTSLGRRRIWLLSLLAVFPLRTSFLYGQMHLLVLFLLALAYFFHCKKSHAACGVCLSIAGAIKIYPLLIGFYFLWKRRWRSAIAITSASLLFLGVGLLWIGRDALEIYVTQILPRSLQGEVLDPYSTHAASAAALFHRLFIFEPTLNPAPWLASASLYAVLYPLWQLAVLVPLLALMNRQGTRAGTEPLEWAAFTLTLLLLSPVPASYQFVVLIFSIVLFVDYLLARRRYGLAALAVALYCMISLIEVFPHGNGTSLLAFGRLSVESVLLGLFLYCLWQNRAKRKVQPAAGLRTASLYAIAVLGWTLGALSIHRHFDYVKLDIGRRMPAALPAYLLTAIHHTSKGYVFTGMVADGYRVFDQAGREVWKDPSRRAPARELSVAAAPHVPGLLLELSDRSGSRIAIIPSLVSSAHGPKDSQPLIANGESPALSATGTSVAFIREQNGRGTLWLGSMEQPLGRLFREPRQLTDNTYDVRNASFAPSGWIVFAARVNGGLCIFTLDPGSQPTVLLSGDEDVDSPAVSPDERFVAFTKLVDHRWQLVTMDVATGHERMLTPGDCNAYSPEWLDATTIAYATDCGRGLGLTAFAAIGIGQAPARDTLSLR